MARLNLTIPDQLYERLEQQRDRINISKISAQALEKELTVLENRRVVDDPKIAQVLLRIQTIQERWHKRGCDDGTQWAVETAKRGELHTIATKMAEWDGTRLMEEVHPGVRSPTAMNALLGSPRLFPSSFRLAERLKNWAAADEKMKLADEVDEAAYLVGWRDAIKEIWEAISPSLQ